MRIDRPRGCTMPGGKFGGWLAWVGLLGVLHAGGCAGGLGAGTDRVTMTIGPTVWGYVYDDDGNPVAGVRITLEESGPIAITDSSGGFGLTVPPGCNGVLRADLDGYEFAPQAWSITQVNSDLHGMDFRATATDVIVSGCVQTPSGGLSGVTIMTSDGAAATTDAQGAYTITLPARWSGTLTPQHEDYDFDPPVRALASVQHSALNQDFLAQLSALSGPETSASEPKDDAHRFIAATGHSFGQEQDVHALPDIEVTPGPTISGAVQRVAAVGANPPVGRIELMLHGTNGWSGIGMPACTAPDGTFSIAVPPGWTGVLMAADPRRCHLEPEQIAFAAPVTSSQTGFSLTVWSPPLGIPAPPFGIHETHLMYADATYDFGSGPEPYRDAGHGPYTHYVDNMHADATDNDNPYGTAVQPRKTIPHPLAPGSVVEVHGGPYSYHIHTDNFKFGGDRLPFVGAGTAAQPIFVRGVSADERPVFAGSTKPVRPEGTYLILENLDLQRWVDIRPKTDMAAALHHIVLRHCEIHEIPHTAVHVGWPHGQESHAEWRDPTCVTDVVIYDTRIHTLGNWEQTGASEDYAGVFPHINAQRLWVLDCAIYHVDGDAIQANTWGMYDDPAVHVPPQWVYIGRNSIYECQENDLDFKVCEDVIVSQNALYGIHDHTTTSDGTAIVVHDDGGTETFPYPQRLWYLYNDVYDADVGFRIQRSDDVYIVGNLIHGICSTYPLLDSGYSSGAAIQCWDNNNIHVFNNVIQGCDYGILSANPNGALHIVNNVIANLTDCCQTQLGKAPAHIFINNASVAAVSTLRHCLLHQQGGSIRIHWNGEFTSLGMFQSATGEGAGCLDADPQFLHAAGGDFHVPAGSPVVGAGVVPELYAMYADLYGENLARDYEGTPRPCGPTDSHDIGPYER